MKIYSGILASIVCLTLLPAHAQFGPPGGGPARGPQLGGATGKLFGDNQTFTATLEMQTDAGPDNPVTLSGKMNYDTGKSRFELNLADMKGGQLPPNAAEQMKAMGMDRVVTIARPDKKIAYTIYPGMQSYVEVDLSDAATANPTNNDYKIETAELGKDTVDGHACVKNKVTVTDKDGQKREFTVWNATDLKKFPLKIQSTEARGTMTMLFKNVSLAKPDGSLFEAPTGFTKYDSVQALIQQQVMKRMGGAPGGFPPPTGN